MISDDSRIHNQGDAYDNSGLLRSSIPGQVWPVVPDNAGALALALQYQLLQSEWWPVERITQFQFTQLNSMVRHAVAQVPYYQARFAEIGFNAGSVLTPEVFARLPALTRRDVQSAGAALFAASIPAQHGGIASGETSGSTGAPVVFRSSLLEQLFWNAFTLRDHLWHRRDLSGRLAAVRYAPAGGTAAGWGPATDAAFVTGDCAILHIDTDLSQQVDWLCERDPVYLLSYASNIRQLALAFMARGLRLPRLREVRSVSEVVGPELRTLVRGAWNVPLTDMYSAKEVGYIALQCPERDVYHVQSENVLVEIVDEDNRPCAPGQAGRVLLTALHKFAMPLIRYEIGDYAVPGEACTCGRGLPTIREIRGRERNMMHLPNGDKRWPLCDLVKEPQLPGILQYQFVQKSHEHLELRLVVGPHYSRNLEPVLREIVHRRLGYPFELAIFYGDSIPRSSGGKYEDFRSEIDAV